MSTDTMFDVSQLLAIGRVQEIVPAPCGTWAAATIASIDEDGAKFIPQLWRIERDPSLSPAPLTDLSYSCRAPSFRYDQSLVFLSNRPTTDKEHNPPKNTDDEPAPSDYFQVFLWSDNTTPTPLTDEPLGVNSYQCAKHADVMVVETPVLPDVIHEDQRSVFEDRKKNGPSSLHYTQMNVRHWDHWLPPQAPHIIVHDKDGRRDLTPNADRAHREGQWHLSADGTKVVITHNQVGMDREDDHVLDIIDISTGNVSHVGSLPRTTYSSVRFSPDGTTLAAIQKTRVEKICGKPHLALFDLTQNAPVALAEDWDCWPEGLEWAEDGQALHIKTRLQTSTWCFRVDIETGTRTRLTPQDGTYENVTLQGDVMWSVFHTLQQPPTACIVEGVGSEAPSQTLRPTETFEGFYPASVSCKNYTVKSTDDAEVQYFVVSPEGASSAPAGSRPVLFFIHGGPISHWGNWWHWRWNPMPFVAQGFTVVLPNPRGSIGFGQEYIEGIWGNQWGAQCYEDVLSVVDDVLERHQELDEHQMVAMGGSFGGYMVNWLGVKTGERFRALISHAGLYSAATFVATDYPAFWNRFFHDPIYRSDEEAERYFARHKLEAWRAPVLLIHGEKDYRVPIGEALALFEGLQYHGVRSELLVFPDENHWINKPRNIAVWYNSILNFIERHMQQNTP
ncbi:MAG: hypothetical protein CL920_04390 [Deltaproteobacteria bacterium]|nr:hypothetical protein [Deltaproteobacteria bacterium]MBU47916.1 hypothetical protein [Deltaproteobacteria bacterium]